MRFLQRAVTGITRRAGKTVILLALVFVLGNVIAGAISIEQSVRNTRNSILQNLIPIATVSVDLNDPNIDHDNLQNITPAEIEAIGNLPMVEFFDYTNTTWLQTDTIRRFEDPDLLESGGVRIMTPDADSPAWFTITGGQSSEILDRRLGRISIVDGRELTEEEVRSGEKKAVVSRNLAELNNLHIGSVLMMDAVIFRFDDREMQADGRPAPARTLNFEFTVVGIYEPIITQTDGNDEMQAWMEMERHNAIYTSNNVTNLINDLIEIENRQVNPEHEHHHRQFLMPFFILQDVESLQTFTEQAEGLMPEFHMVTDNRSGFNNISAPIDNMSSIATIILFVSIGASLLILSLLITLFLKERRHEIGIYYSLGERKVKIVGQILTEVMLIALVAITLALFSGNFISSQLSNSMIENQVIAQQQAENSRMGFVRDFNILDNMGYGVNMTLEDLANQYSVTLGLRIILTFYMVGLFTVLLSTLAPILYVLKLNPKKILM